MPNGIGGFVETFFMAEGLKNQRAELAMQEQNSQIERARIVTEMAKLTDTPQGRDSLGNMLQDPDMMEFLDLNNLLPFLETQVRRSAFRGQENMDEETRTATDRAAAIGNITGQSEGRFRQDQILADVLHKDASPEEVTALRGEAVSTSVTGMSQEQVARSSGFASLPEVEQQSAIRMTAGLELDAMEQEQIAQWAATNGFNWAQLAQNGAIQTARLQLDAMQLDLMTAGGSGGGPAGDMLASANTLWNQLDEALSAIETGQKTDPALQTQIIRLNTAIVQLTRMGQLPMAADGTPLVPLMSTDVTEIDPRMFRFMRGELPQEIDRDTFLQGFPQPGGGQQELLGRQPTISEMIQETLNQIQQRRPLPEEGG